MVLWFCGRSLQLQLLAKFKRGWLYTRRWRGHAPGTSSVIAIHSEQRPLGQSYKSSYMHPVSMQKARKNMCHPSDHCARSAKGVLLRVGSEPTTSIKGWYKRLAYKAVPDSGAIAVEWRMRCIPIGRGWSLSFSKQRSLGFACLLRCFTPACQPFGPRNSHVVPVILGVAVF